MRRSPADAAALARAIPLRPLTTADRLSEEARPLERSRATLDWEAHVTTMETALAGLGGRAYTLGEDRWGQSYFTLGAHSPHVFVVGALERVNAAPRRAAAAAAAAAAGSAPSATAAALPSPLSSNSDLPSTARRRVAAVPGGGFGLGGTARPVAVSAQVQHLNAAAVNEAAARRACTLQPGEWGVYDSPASLAALIRSLHPLGRAEGPLRAALLRREPLLVAAMRAEAAGRDAGPSVARAPTAAAAPAVPDAPLPPALADAAETAPPSACCAFCADPLPSPAPADAAAPAPALHCFVCHTSFATAAPMAAAARALLSSHVRRCWAAAAHAPVTRAIAVACARAAPLGRPSDGDLQEAAAAAGAPVADVAAAFDPALAQLRRQAVCLAEAVDWTRLRQPAVWPPAARAQWAAKVLAAASGGELNRLLHVLVRALQADDSAAYAMAVATAPKQREGGRKHTQAELAEMAEKATYADESAPPGSLLWRWVPFWFLDRMPSAEAVVGMRTAAAAAWTLRSVAAMLRPNLLAQAAPPPLATEALV